jgi:curli production assembly/transport component CsgF
MKYALVTIASWISYVCSANADMVYKPINPSFGGDPFNANFLQSMATSQNTHKADPRTTETQSASERFISLLESRLYSSLASQVAEAIFGANAQPTGTITFDDQEISFVNTGTEIQITVTDFATGGITHITVPTLN